MFIYYKSPIEIFFWKAQKRIDKSSHNEYTILAAKNADVLELVEARNKVASTIFCSQYDCNGWYDQLGGDDSPLSEAILDRIKHDAYKINIIPTDPANYRSMREVYGLDSALSE